MIAYLKGKIIYKDINFIILENNGIGYKVFLSAVRLSNLKEGEEVELFTHEQGREDGRELYGFLNIEELKLFWKLVSVSGVGPKSAQNILGLDSPGKIESAITAGDVAFLTRVSGIGKKIAERMILELKGKLIMDEEGGDTSDQEAIDALYGLGYSKSEAQAAINKLDDAKTTEAKIKGALKILGSRI